MDLQGKSYGCSVASPYVGSDRCLLIVFANPVRAEKKLKAVASFSILSDFVRQIGGELARCTGHGMRPRPMCSITLSAFTIRNADTPRLDI
jgi:hypothetical protein